MKKIPNLNKYREYRSIQLYQCIDHIFISEKKKNLFSKMLFSISLFILVLSFKNEDIFWIILIIGLILIMIFLRLTYNDLKDLMLSLKLIYFMKLFIQENNLINKQPIKDFIQYIEHNLWFEAQASFSQFLDAYLTSISEPFQAKIIHGVIIENFCNFFEQFPNLGRKPHHEIANYFFNEMNLDISAGTNQSGRYSLDYINPIRLSFLYLQKFVNTIYSWDDWLTWYVFRKDYIELNKLIRQIDKMINLFDKNNEYQKLVNKLRLLESEDIEPLKIHSLKEEIYTQYQKIISHFATLNNKLELLNIKNFFKKDLLKKYLEKIRETVYFLDTNLRLKERMTRKQHQEVFTAISETLKSFIQNYELLPYQYDVSAILQHIDLLNKFKFDLDKFNIFVDFSKPHEIKFKLDPELEIIIPFKQEDLLSRKIKNIKTANPQVDLVKQKRVIHEYLNKCSENFNLKIEDEVFWKEFS